MKTRKYVHAISVFLLCTTFTPMHASSSNRIKEACKNVLEQIKVITKKIPFQKSKRLPLLVALQP